jgi:UDP-2-acetamido-3-amino-2,3-dideoxy-glucuronate N-acetyltransferase
MKIHESAEVSPTAKLGREVSVWHFSRIREAAIIGDEVNIGANVYIGPGVNIGDRCKVQNSAQIFEPAILGEGVFIGPSVILTNDRNPRAVNLDFSQKSEIDWEKEGVKVSRGASIGAGAICVAPIHIGAWSMVAAGSVLVTNAPDYSLMAGVPAKQIGWIGEAGFKLEKMGPTRWKCPKSQSLYELSNTGTLTKVT